MSAKTLTPRYEATNSQVATSIIAAAAGHPKLVAAVAAGKDPSSSDTDVSSAICADSDGFFQASPASYSPTSKAWGLFCNSGVGSFHGD